MKWFHEKIEDIHNTIKDDMEIMNELPDEQKEEWLKEIDRVLDLYRDEVHNILAVL